MRRSPCGVYELLQLLVVDPETFAHRLHRLPAALEHQLLQIQASLGSLVLPDQRGEHLAHEPGQLLPHIRDLISAHATEATQRSNPEDLTKYY